MLNNKKLKLLIVDDSVLFRSQIRLPFIFYCSKRQRQLRFEEEKHIEGPVDKRERKLEDVAADKSAIFFYENVNLSYDGTDVYDLYSTDGGTSSDMPRNTTQRRFQRQNSVRGGRGNNQIKHTRPIKLVPLTPSGLPKFYHSKTCIALTAQELRQEEDSDDESDTEDYMVRFLFVFIP